MKYFAYGAGMYLKHMEKLCQGHAQSMGAAHLVDFEFGFNESGYANIVKTSGKEVWGFCLKLTSLHLKNWTNLKTVQHFISKSK